MKADNAEPFPWAQVMRFGFGILKLPPKHFWQLTPLELAAAMRAYSNQIDAPDKAALASLMQQFPDTLALKGKSDG